MNAKRIEGMLGLAVLAVATVVVVTLSATPQDGAQQRRLQPTGGEPAFTARELAEREALLHAAPTRYKAERMRIEAIARAEGRSEREAQAIADAVLNARAPKAKVASR